MCLKCYLFFCQTSQSCHNLYFLSNETSFIFSLFRCGPCKLMLPKITKLAEQMDDVIFLKLDCNQHNKVCALGKACVCRTIFLASFSVLYQQDANHTRFDLVAVFWARFFISSAGTLKPRDISLVACLNGSVWMIWEFCLSSVMNCGNAIWS